MKDYGLAPGDAHVSGGDLVMVSEPRATRQRLEQKFGLWQGEWFLNVDAGFPWIQDVLGQRANPDVVRSLVHDLVSRDPGVASVRNISLELNGRSLRIQFTAGLTDGATEDMDIIV